MRWKKLGKIFDSSILEKNWTHTSVPFAEVVTDKVIKIYFSSRDVYNKSSTFYLYFDIEKFTMLDTKPQIVLEPGKLGCFDDSGAMGSCLVDVGAEKYLYYIGWNLGVTIPFRNSIGLAISQDNGESYEKFSDGPIIDRNHLEPHFTASCCVIFDDGKFKIWYLSCTKWEKLIDVFKHYYHIKYAESDDGIHWDRQGLVAIDFKDEYEYAISVPRVIVENDSYKMWFSSRSDKNNETYRIRYAESLDGFNWKRFYDVGIDVSLSGWDSEMICYPFVFKLNGKLYMLFNGNGFGKTGVGLAIMEEL